MGRRRAQEEEHEDQSDLLDWEEMDQEAMDDARDEIDAETGGNYWKPSEGENIIRILPGRKGEPKPYKKVYEHYVTLADESRVRIVCARKMSRGKERCLVCEEADRLSSSRNVVDQKRAKKLFPKFTAYFNVVDRKHPERGVMIYGASVGVFRDLDGIRKSTEGGDYSNPTKGGFDIVITREGTGMKTKYKVTPARKDSALGDMELLAGRKNLTQLAVCLDTRGQRALMSGDKDAAYADDDDEPRSRRRLPAGDEEEPRSRRRRRTAEDDIENDAPDVTDEDEEPPL